MDTTWALLKQPLLSKFLVKFNKTCSAKRLDVCLVNESSIHQTEVRIYKLANNKIPSIYWMTLVHNQLTFCVIPLNTYSGMFIHFL